MSDQPTGDSPATASPQTPAAAPPAPEITDDAVKAHPAFQEMERQKNAAEQNASTWKGRLEKVQQTVKGEEPTPPEPKPSDKPGESQYVTKEELWENNNRAEITLAGEEYTKRIEAGVPRDLALGDALRAKGYADQASVQNALRQAESSSAPSTVNRLGGDSRPPEQQAMDQRMGVQAEDHQKYGERAKRMTSWGKPE